LGVGWCLSADTNADLLTPARVWFGLVAFLVAWAPFVAGVASFVTALRTGRGVSAALYAAAWWTGGLGLLAMITAAVWTGGL
jgi:hypothetical protein